MHGVYLYGSSKFIIFCLIFQFMNYVTLNDQLIAQGTYFKTNFWVSTCSDWALHWTWTLIKNIQKSKQYKKTGKGIFHENC